MRCLTFFLTVLLVLPAWAGGLPAPVDKALRAANVAQDGVAVYVQRVDKPRPFIAFNAAQAMNPASTMKLVTTYAGLELLGPAYTWKTEAYINAPVNNGVLEGDLTLKGYGDPALTLENFWDMLRALHVPEVFQRQSRVAIALEGQIPFQHAIVDRRINIGFGFPGIGRPQQLQPGVSGDQLHGGSRIHRLRGVEGDERTRLVHPLHVHRYAILRNIRGTQCLGNRRGKTARPRRQDQQDSQKKCQATHKVIKSQDG